MVKKIEPIIFSMLLVFGVGHAIHSQNTVFQTKDRKYAFITLKEKDANKTNIDNKQTKGEYRFSKKPKKVPIKIINFYFKPTIPTIENGESITLNSSSIKTNETKSIFTKIADNIDNIWTFHDISFAIGASPPYDYSTSSCVGVDIQEGVIFPSLGGKNGIKNQIWGTTEIDLRKRPGDILTFKLFIYSYKQDRMPCANGNFPQKLEKVKTLGSGKLIVTSKAKYDCIIHFDGINWKLEFIKQNNY